MSSTTNPVNIDVPCGSWKVIAAKSLINYKG
jgi:hypothetical protein